VVFHNCQPNEKDHVVEISVKDAEVAEELEHLFLNRRMLNMDRHLWGDVKNGLCKGDHFYELLIDLDEPTSGVLGVQRLPAESMYRIETTKGKLLEFQQAADGPDYQALVNQVEVGTPVSTSERGCASAFVGGVRKSRKHRHELLGHNYRSSMTPASP
jgi:hypothetical protein